MSFLGKKWIVKNTAQDKDPLAKILSNRGVEDINEGLTLHDPFLFENMVTAVERVKEAIEKQDRIIVFGDYDVDGISGATIMINTLKKLGANVSYRLPHRVNDGYGLTEKFIDEFIEKNINLIITVDCGISCRNEVKKARENNIDIIITDHHTIPDVLPEGSTAILHPRLNDSKYPFNDLTGAGVALKFSQALLTTLLAEKFNQEEFEELVTLASLGTVADLGVLKGENRLIVKKGLENLLTTKSNGLKKIIELSGIKEGFLDTHSISFRIAPRINAAGRIGDPYVALSLLLQEEANEKTHLLGQKLEDLNIERQVRTEKAVQEAEKFFTDQAELPYIFIADNPDWHVGILGLIVAKLVEKYNRPAIIMQDLGETLVASARSPKFFHLTDSLNQFSDHLISFGGHAQAAGFNIKKENLEKFKEQFQNFTAKALKNTELTPVMEIDCELGEKDISFELIDKLKALEPFGIGNEKPTFLLKNIEPYFVGQVGSEKNHLKFVIKSGDKEVQVIGFHLGKFADDLRQNKKIDIACNLEKNIWNNREYLQCRAIDIRESI